MLRSIQIFVMALMLSCFVYTPSAKASGIPVVDGASIAQDAANFLETMAHYAQQLQHYQQDFEQQVKYYQSMTDVRGMMNALNSYYNKILEITPEHVLKQFDIQNPQDFFNMTDRAFQNFDQGVKTASEWLSRVNKYQEETVNRFTELEKLIAKTGTLQDPKDALDLQARIQAEQAMLQNETIKQMLVMQQAQAEKMMQEQKQLETHLKWGQRKGVPAF